jgi:NADH-quinone oxidoreductase subunit L
MLLLAVLSLFGGLLEVRQAQVLPATEANTTESLVLWVTGAAPFLGILVAFLLYGPTETRLSDGIGFRLHRLCFNGFGFDWLYERLLVLPYLRLAKLNKNDVVDSFYRGIVILVRFGHRLLASTQTGRLRWYAAAMVFGTVLALAMGVWR